MSDMKCRCCGSALNHLVVDLGLSPLCESLVYADQLDEPETFYPLRVYVCDQCWLVQLHDHVSGVEIFDDTYAYASSMSSTWLKHCERYTEAITNRLALGHRSLVVEIASNDGYLLKNFVKHGIPCLGIEPASRLAALSETHGIPVCKQYFGSRLADQLRSEGHVANLMIGNNVLAHVPDLHDFLDGFRRLLADEGTITFEFPHLLNLIDKNQFDTIYQEHYCYLSIIALQRAFSMNGLRSMMWKSFRRMAVRFEFTFATRMRRLPRSRPSKNCWSVSNFLDLIASRFSKTSLHESVKQSGNYLNFSSRLEEPESVSQVMVRQAKGTRY